VANTTKVTIMFKSYDKTTRVPAGMTVFNAANWIGLPIDSTWGARGTCGKCKIRILEGQSDTITAPDRRFFSKEELAQGWRLSCRTEAHHDIVCDVPRLMGNPKAALMGYGRHVILNPNVHKVLLNLPVPSLQDQRSDARRLSEALTEAGFKVTIPLGVMRQLPGVLREARWQVTAVVENQALVGVEPGDTTGRSYGLALDIGTTTVVGMLMDLNSGAPVAVRSMLNGQAVYGADVLARINHAALNPEGLSRLQEKIGETLNSLIGQLSTEADVSPNEIYGVVIVGNATIRRAPGSLVWCRRFRWKGSRRWGMCPARELKWHYYRFEIDRWPVSCLKLWNITSCRAGPISTSRSSRFFNFLS